MFDENILINEIVKRTLADWEDTGCVLWYSKPVAKLLRHDTDINNFINWLQNKVEARPIWRLPNGNEVIMLDRVESHQENNGRWTLKITAHTDADEFSNVIEIDVIQFSDRQIDLKAKCYQPVCLGFFVWLLGEIRPGVEIEYLNTLAKMFGIEQSEPPAGDNGTALTEDDQLKAELERLFPNPKTLEKTRKRLFEIIKLKRASPHLTKGQLANYFVVSEETIKVNLRMLEGHDLI